MSRLYRRNRDLSQPLERIEMRVDKPDEGRFDRFLAGKIRWRSRAGVQALIENGQATLNGERRKPSTKVRAGDVVVVEVRRDAPADPPPEPEIRVLYEDEHLMALDKQTGVVVHPVGNYQEGTLLQALHARCKGPELPKLAHRLDQHTSGVLLVAKRDEVRRRFSDMLEHGQVAKTYEALLLGVVGWDERDVDAPIAPVGDSRILMGVDADRGKAAHSVFACVERLPFATHARIRIGTGRTHQIRVHAAHLGHPLIGDHLYGDGIALDGFESFVLHARAVSFRHPMTGAPLVVEAPLPDAFLQAVGRMRATS